MHRRRYPVPTQPSRINDLQHHTIGEPQSSVRRPRGSLERSVARLHTIESVKDSHLQRDIWILPPPLQLEFRNLNQPALHIEPKVTCAVRNEGINRVTWESVPRRKNLLLSVSPTDNP